MSELNSSDLPRVSSNKDEQSNSNDAYLLIFNIEKERLERQGVRVDFIRKRSHQILVAEIGFLILLLKLKLSDVKLIAPFKNQRFQFIKEHLPGIGIAIAISTILVVVWKICTLERSDLKLKTMPTSNELNQLFGSKTFPNDSQIMNLLFPYILITLKDNEVNIYKMNSNYKFIINTVSMQIVISVKIVLIAYLTRRI